MNRNFKLLLHRRDLPSLLIFVILGHLQILFSNQYKFNLRIINL